MDINKHGLICLCFSADHAEAEATRLEVQERLGVRPDQLSSALLFSLAWDFGAEVEVTKDTWFAVLARLNGQKEYVECDRPIDGLAYLWKIFADKYPEKITRGNSYIDDSELSSLQITELIRLERVWADHKKCLNCTSDKLCHYGEIAWEKVRRVNDALLNKWGEPEDCYVAKH